MSVLNIRPYLQIAGFSLLEAMVVLALMMTLMHLLSPAWASHLRYHQQSATFHQLYRDLQRARGVAMSHNIAVSVCPSQDGLRCEATNVWQHGWIVFFDAHRLGQPGSRHDLINQSTPPLDGFITSGGRTTIRFSPQGTAYGSNGTLRHCAKDHLGKLQSIVISNPGRIRLQTTKNHEACEFL